MQLLVLAKEPVPGRVKTRLCPPCSEAEAAAIAEAALADTLLAALGAGADRVVLALDGRPGDWCPTGVEVIAQSEGGLDQRLAAAWAAVGERPTVQIGMDTPQVGAAGLAGAMAALADVDVDAVLGPTLDGGWWAAGMCRPEPRAFLGVPMSRSDTGALQRARFTDDLGWRVADLPLARDIDTWLDAVATGYAGRRGTERQ